MAERGAPRPRLPGYALGELAVATGGRLEGATAAAVATGVTTDSRDAVPGDLFVALRGPSRDGHDFVRDALDRGAVAALVARPVDGAPCLVVPDTLAALGRIARLHRDRINPTVIGVTGSVGKTTTAAMIAAVLGGRLRVHASEESWNAEQGVPLTLLGVTPGVQVAIVEMAMRGAGQIRDLVEIARPDIGVVTMVGESHLEFLGSLEAVATAKGELIEGLPERGAAVLNADDPRVLALRTRARCRVLTYGFAPGADVRAEAVALRRDGATFGLVTSAGETAATIAALGTHNVRNALAAAAVGRALGLDLPELAAGLARIRPASMRLNLLEVGHLTVLDDTYNASPTSTRAALEVLQETARGDRTIAVIGEMRELGAESERWHREVGEAAAAAGVAHLIAVGPGGRWIAEAARAAGLPRVAAADSAEEAVGILAAILERGDVVLVKGSRALGLERVVGALRSGVAAVR